jgi:hypothetical protein
MCWYLHQATPVTPDMPMSSVQKKSPTCNHLQALHSCRACWLFNSLDKPWGIFCQHGTQKSRCRLCGGKGVCEHGCLEFQCLRCNTGSRLCIHKFFKDRCMLHPCQEERLARCNQAQSISSLSGDLEIDSDDDNGAAAASTLTGD